jgi:hypothetical protein
VPERLNNITVQTRHGFLSLPWDTRVALLARIRSVETLKPTVVAIDAVGATRPVEIPQDQKQALLDALNAWPDELPEGLPALRDDWRPNSGRADLALARVGM